MDVQPAVAEFCEKLLDGGGMWFGAGDDDGPGEFFAEGSRADGPGGETAIRRAQGHGMCPFADQSPGGFGQGLDAVDDEMIGAVDKKAVHHRWHCGQ